MLGSASKDADFSILFFAKQKHMRLACFTIKVSSPKERMRTHMLTTNYIEFFFHIKEEYITGRYQTDEGLVYEVQLPVTTRTCPYCGL